MAALEKEMKYYFNQFWAFTNPEILTLDDMRPLLYEIWREIYVSVPKCFEGKLFLINKLYKERILKGKQRGEESRNCLQQPHAGRSTAPNLRSANFGIEQTFLEL